MNITDFFARRPFQISISPGLSSHGTFSSQVVNKFSLNLAGGYTAGTDGLEIGGLFNINKGEAKYLQLAGAFNLVGGNMTGLQLAGAHNRALDTVRGVQLSLFTNDAENQLSGLQISALHNYTGHLKGVQIGLINVADSSDGASVGVLNIIRNGFYKISYSINDLANTNITLKTGTHDFYSTLLTSVNVSDKNKFFAFGLGIGHDFMLSDIWYFSAETNYQFAYTGSLTDRWIQGKLIVNVQLSKSASLFAGPTYNRYSYTGSQSGFQSRFRIPKDYVAGDRNPVKVWTGWEAGIAFNSIFKPARKSVDNSAAWYIGLAGSGGIAWDQPYGSVTGAEISLQRDLGASLTGTITTGYTHFSARGDYLFSRLGDIYFYAKPVAIVPLNAGIRLKASKRFYIGGDIGAAFGGKESRIVDKSPTSPAVNYPNTSYNGLMYGLSGGFMFRNGLEAGIKFEDYGLESQYKQLALRLGYRIKLTN